MRPLMSRIVSEKKSWLVLLAVLLGLNVLAYLFVVRPMAAASSGAGARAVAAADARRLAERTLADVEARQTAQRQARTDLQTFQGQILPASLAEARRLTYASLPALADDAGVTYQRRRSEVAPADDDSRLQRLTTVMELQGSYRQLREFIHAVELAPDFIVIDDVTITEVNAGEPLGLVMTLSTYFPEAGDER